MSVEARKTITVEIQNLTEAQAVALEDLFSQWQRLGAIGSSRWTAFFADGDGNFQPKIKVNGDKAKACEYGNPEGRWKSKFSGSIYMIDFDEIAAEVRETGKLLGAAEQIKKDAAPTAATGSEGV